MYVPVCVRVHAHTPRARMCMCSPRTCSCVNAYVRMLSAHPRRARQPSAGRPSPPPRRRARRRSGSCCGKTTACARSTPRPDRGSPAGWSPRRQPPVPSHPAPGPVCTTTHQSRPALTVGLQQAGHHSDSLPRCPTPLQAQSAPPHTSHAPP